ncbi:MAG: FAD-binding oxidoreductase [Oscillatoriales cyanobacterium C42_A2020_001]|nr:FAD-binding oxidoreductase [Leptolyngbyaceae cyanobacterium C42_A2020_001]
MPTVDWLVVGGGITGSALAYELAKQGASVLVLERHADLCGGTRFGYGGVAYWSGTTNLTRQLCAEGIARLRELSEELDADIEFRELDLVLTISAGSNPVEVAQSYAHFAIPPKLVDEKTACELEPLLNPVEIAGALTVKHGHIHLGKAAKAYRDACTRLGGTVQVGEVTDLLRDRHQTERIVGVACGDEPFYASNVVICAGALSRALLKAAGISVPLYFTHAELIETPPIETKLRSLVMPAQTKRFELEAEASKAEINHLWDEPGHEPTPPILDAGAIQFLDGHLRIGQMSRTLTDPTAPIDARSSEQSMREQVGKVLPALKHVPGTWHRCLVSFSRDRLPLIGAIPNLQGIHLFSGFSNPLAITPSLAQRFANAAFSQPDELLQQVSLGRFS